MYKCITAFGLSKDEEQKARDVFSHRGGFFNYKLGEGMVLSQYAEETVGILKKDGCKAYIV